MSTIPSSLFEIEATQLNENAKLTVLSLGMGQESIALLYRYVYDEEFRAKYAPNDFLVIYCDTGDEFPQTYEYAEHVKEFCEKHGIELRIIEPSMGYHYDGWHSLGNHFETYNSIMGVGLLRTCTDKLKIQPFHRYLEDHLSERYDLPSGKKRAHKQFAQLYGHINVLIGFASNEESRMRTTPFQDKWKAQSIRHIYPLVEMGADRQACQDYIEEVGHEVPIPSNCMMCPFAADQELIYLYRFHHKKWLQWVEYERKKIERDVNRGKEKTYGVKGKWLSKENRPFTLVDALAEAEAKFGHYTDEQLIEYRMSHGHCVQSSY